MIREEEVVPRRIVVRRKVWDEVSRIAEETGLGAEEVMRRAIEAGLPEAHRMAGTAPE